MSQTDLAATPIAAALRTGWISAAVVESKCSGRVVADKLISGRATVRVPAVVARNGRVAANGLVRVGAVRKDLAPDSGPAEENVPAQGNGLLAEGSVRLHGRPAAADGVVTPWQAPEVAAEVQPWRRPAATQVWAVAAARAVAAVQEREVAVVHALEVGAVVAVVVAAAVVAGRTSRSSTISFCLVISTTALASIASATTAATEPMSV